MPSERAWSTLRRVTSVPSTKIRPASGWWKPQITLIRVDLPAPLSPMQAEHLAPVDAQVDVAQRGQGTEPLGHALDPQ